MKIDVMLYDASPEMLRAVAAIAAQESVVVNLSRKDVVAAIEKGLAEAPEPQSSTTQDNPLGNESSAFAAPAPKKRGRPAKNPELNAETPDPEILPEAPAPVPVNPVVTMPNGVVLNAPAAAPAEVSALPPLAQVVADYAKAFQIAGLSALAKREGVTKFSELPEDRQTTLKREMLDAISLGVAAA